MRKLENGINSTSLANILRHFSDLVMNISPKLCGIKYAVFLMTFFKMSGGKGGTFFWFSTNAIKMLMCTSKCQWKMSFFIFLSYFILWYFRRKYHKYLQVRKTLKASSPPPQCGVQIELLQWYSWCLSLQSKRLISYIKLK